MRISGITRHATERFQKRSVPAQIFNLLEEYGDVERSHGCDVLFFSKAAKARIARDWGKEFRHIERWMKVFAVVADSGAVVTVGHRTKRITRH